MALTNARLTEVSQLVEEALSGNKIAQGKIKNDIESFRNAEESMSTSDFPAALKAITSVAFLGQYEQIQSVWTQYAKPYNVSNLKPQAFYSLTPHLITDNFPDVSGGEVTVKGPPSGIPRIPELTEYPTVSFSASESSFGVAKYGARVNFSFEMLLNDEWGVLETLPDQLAQLARNQEDIVATEVLASPVGPNAVFFNNANRNLVTTGNGFKSNNPALTIDSLENAMSVIRGRSFNGNPVQVGQFALMVPPALEAEARRLLGITAFQITDPVNGIYTTTNPVSGTTLIVNPWLTIIDKSATANTTWYLLPAGSAGIRPAVVFSKIRGRETPELRIASATGNYLGGGEVPGREGSFLNDDIEFRIRYFMGAAGIAYEVTAVSTGVGGA